MTRYGILLAIAGMTWLSANGPVSADEQAPFEPQLVYKPKALCDGLHSLVFEQKSFKFKDQEFDRNSDPGDVEIALDWCQYEENLHKALDIARGFQDVQDPEYGPYGQIWGDMTEKEIQEAMDRPKIAAKKVMDGYRKQFKAGTLDEASFKAALRYLIWQSNDYMAGRAGAELEARMYPKEYASLEPLSKDQHYIDAPNPNDNAWVDMRDVWLPELDKADKH